MDVPVGLQNGQSQARKDDVQFQGKVVEGLIVELSMEVGTDQYGSWYES